MLEQSSAMIPTVNVLSLCAGLAVVSATLLIYLAFFRDPGRPTTWSEDPADPDLDRAAVRPPTKAPVAKPAPSLSPEPARARGGGLKLVAAIIYAVAAILSVSALQSVRKEIRRQFDMVASQITADRPPEIIPGAKPLNATDFRGLTFPVGPFPQNDIGRFDALPRPGPRPIWGPRNQGVSRFR
jgi:hypothetical protein